MPGMILDDETERQLQKCDDSYRQVSLQLDLARVVLPVEVGFRHRSGPPVSIRVDRHVLHGITSLLIHQRGPKAARVLDREPAEIVGWPL